MSVSELDGDIALKVTTGSLLTALKHPPEAETLGLPTATDGPEMVLGALEGPSVCQDAQLPLPALGLDGENSIVLCGYLPTWFGKCQLSPRWGHALTRTNTFLDIFPTSSSGMFLIPLFSGFFKVGVPPTSLVCLVWFKRTGREFRVRASSQALLHVSDTGPGPQVLAFLPQAPPAMGLLYAQWVAGGNLHGGREGGNRRLREQVLSGRTKRIHWKGKEQGPYYRWT